MGVFVKNPRDLEFLTDELLAEASRLFDRAEEAAWADPVTLHRVQVARLPVIYSNINLALDPQPPSQRERPSAQEMLAWIERFERITNKEGVTQGGAGHSLEPWIESVRRAVAKPEEPDKRDNGVR
jgi:hypothetical protein